MHQSKLKHLDITIKRLQQKNLKSTYLLIYHITYNKIKNQGN